MKDDVTGSTSTDDGRAAGTDEGTSGEVAAGTGGDDALFVVGPPDPVDDSRRLPAVTPEDEDPFVTGAGLDGHPDDAEQVPDDDAELVLDTDDGELAASEGEGEASTDDLDALVADDDHEVDEVGFDDGDEQTVDGGSGLVGQDEGDA